VNGFIEACMGFLIVALLFGVVALACKQCDSIEDRGALRGRCEGRGGRIVRAYDGGWVCVAGDWHLVDVRVQP
jgi:hypothetical protein